MRLVDQWRAIQGDLPPDWEVVRLTLTTESRGDLPRAAALLGSAGAGRADGALTLHVHRTGGAIGPQGLGRLFARLDAARVWCTLERGPVSTTAPAATDVPPAQTLAERWDAALAPLPDDWSDLLCELSLTSSDFLERAALLCAPLNPTRDGSRLAFTFRCAHLAGYGVSPRMARRCLERLGAEEITGDVRVLRVLSDTHNVSTQGAVWYVGGRVL